MKSRVFKNWKTSLMGLLLLVFGMLLVWFNKIEFAEFLGFIPFCLGLIYVKDSIFKR